MKLNNKQDYILFLRILFYLKMDNLPNDILFELGKFVKLELSQLNKHLHLVMIDKESNNISSESKLWILNSCKYQINYLFEKLVLKNVYLDLDIIFMIIFNNNIFYFDKIVYTAQFHMLYKINGVQILKKIIMYNRVEFLKRMNILINDDFLKFFMDCISDQPIPKRKFMKKNTKHKKNVKTMHYFNLWNKKAIKIEFGYSSRKKIIDYILQYYNGEKFKIIMNNSINFIESGNYQFCTLVLNNTPIFKNNFSSIIKSLYLKRDKKYNIIYKIVEKFGEKAIDSDLYKWTAEDQNIKMTDIFIKFNCNIFSLYSWTFRYSSEKITIKCIKSKNKDFETFLKKDLKLKIKELLIASMFKAVFLLINKYYDYNCMDDMIEIFLDNLNNVNFLCMNLMLKKMIRHLRISNITLKKNSEILNLLLRIIDHNSFKKIKNNGILLIRKRFEYLINKYNDLLSK